MSDMTVTITWSPSDIEDVTDLSPEQAATWLAKNGKHLKDRSIELGWGVIEDLLHMDGIEFLP